jgi:DNA-binding response OmpR family regulator
MRGIEFDGLDRSIDNCVSRLRRKFDDAASERIKTVWGEGYLFSPSAWE